MTKSITIASPAKMVYSVRMSDDKIFTGDSENPDMAADENGQSSPDDILASLQDLRNQHRHLDSEITALQQTGVTDMLKIARMKKLKLKLKDRIRALEEQLTPDIIA